VEFVVFRVASHNTGVTSTSDTLVHIFLGAVVLSFALKILATGVLLSVDKDVRYRPGWGSGLWWATKITPLIAAPSATWIGVLEGLPLLVWVGTAMTLFAVVAVPMKIGQRRREIAKRTSPKPIV
jgi:hypothetical protein